VSDLFNSLQFCRAALWPRDRHPYDALSRSISSAMSRHVLAVSLSPCRSPRWRTASIFVGSIAKAGDHRTCDLLDARDMVVGRIIYARISPEGGFCLVDSRAVVNAIVGNTRPASHRSRIAQVGQALPLSSCRRARQAS
jgi:hypothetical protein